MGCDSHERLGTSLIVKLSLSPLHPPVEHLPFLFTIRRLTRKWNVAGKYLGVPDSELDAIQENNRGAKDMCGDCLRDVFIWLLRNGEEFTAQNLVQALHKVDKDSADEAPHEIGKYSADEAPHEVDEAIYQRFGKLE